MSNSIRARVEQLGLSLPPLTSPAANYVSRVRTGNLLYLSGQIAQQQGEPAYIGKLGREFNVEQGQIAALSCGLSLIAHIIQATDDRLDQVRKVVRLGGFVNATPEFADHSQVVNGASDLMVSVFGDAGRHVRTSVGVGSLPVGVAVEVDAIIELA